MSNNQQKGQTIVVIFFIMVMALIVGVAISNRFISTLRTSTRTYTNYRAQAVAEAALERILTKTVQELEDYINFGSCGSDCYLEIVNDDGVTETANITLSYLGNSSDPYFLPLETDSVAEVNLITYSNNTDLTICWNGTGINPLPSVYASLLYGQIGSYELSNFAYNTVGSVASNGFNEAAGGSGYDSCFTINSETDPQFLRLRSIYSDVEVAVIPDPSETIPSQGILIESVGEVLDTTKKISVIKGNNLTPLPYDYALFSKSESFPLSN